MVSFPLRMLIFNSNSVEVPEGKLFEIWNQFILIRNPKRIVIGGSRMGFTHIITDNIHYLNHEQWSLKILKHQNDTHVMVGCGKEWGREPSWERLSRYQPTTISICSGNQTWTYCQFCF